MEWESRIILVGMLIFFIGCNENKKKESIEKKTVKVIQMNDTDKYYEILRKNGFVFPSEEIYNAKLKEVFGMDLSLYSNVEQVEINPRPIVLDDERSDPIAIKSKRFILWYADPSSGDEQQDNLAFFNLNKYIFYNDKAALVYLKSQKDLNFLYSLVQDFGYRKDQDLIDYLLRKTDGDLSDTYAYNLFFGRNGVAGHWELRKELFESYLDIYPKTDIYGSGFITSLIDKDNQDYIKKYEGERERDISFLLEKIIFQARKRGDLKDGAVNSVLETYPDYLKILKKNQAFGYPLLNDYIKQSPPIPNCIVQDPDGYTNLRKEKNTTSKILQKIKTGDEVSVIDTSGDWWYVSTKEDNMGYIHKSKLRSE